MQEVQAQQRDMQSHASTLPYPQVLEPFIVPGYKERVLRDENSFAVVEIFIASHFHSMHCETALRCRTPP